VSTPPAITVAAHELRLRIADRSVLILGLVASRARCRGGNRVMVTTKQT